MSETWLSEKLDELGPYFSFWMCWRYSMTTGSVQGAPNGASSPATQPRWPPAGVTINKQFGFSWNRGLHITHQFFIVLCYHSCLNYYKWVNQPFLSEESCRVCTLLTKTSLFSILGDKWEDIGMTWSIMK